jgi:hypothetical protein
MTTFSFGFAHHKVFKAVVFGLVVLALVVGFSLAPALSVNAAPSGDQPIELDNGAYNTNKPTFKLVAVGWTVGCKKGTRNLDYKFRLDFGTRFPGPFNPEQFRVKTWNSKVEQALRNSGETIMGYNLYDRNSAYVCVGIRVMNAGGSAQTISVYENR